MDRLGDALRRILVEVDVGGAVRQIEIGKNGFSREQIGDAKGTVMGDRRGADASLGARDGDDAPDRLCIGCAIEATNGAHHLHRADGSNQVIADPATKELAVKHHVVVTPDDDSLHTFK